MPDTTPQRESNASSKKVDFFPILWVIGWTLVTLFFDVELVNGFWRQTTATSFPTVTGKVLESSVKRERTKNGYQYSAKVRYAYQVSNKHYLGETIRFRKKHYTEAEAHSWVENHPRGQEIKIYYSPDNPNESLLSPGVIGADFFACLFLTPFNIIMLGSWYFSARHFKWIGREASKAIDVVQLICDEAQSSKREAVTIYRNSPFFYAAIILLISSFVSTFIVGIGVSNNPSLGIMFIVIAINLSLSFLPLVFTWLRRRKHQHQVIVDPQHKLIFTPYTFTSPLLFSHTIPFTSVTSIEMESEFQPSEEDEEFEEEDDSGGEEHSSEEITPDPNEERFVPRIDWTDESGDERFSYLGDHTHRERALAIVDWLQEHVFKK